MTNPDFTIKEQSDRPTFADQLTDADGNAVDLTNATEVRFYQWGPAGNLLIDDATATSITDAANGKVEYDYSQGQVVRQGANPAEWRVEHADGDIQWLPQDRNLEIHVTKSGGDRDIAAEDLDEQDATVSVLTADRINTDELGLTLDGSASSPSIELNDADTGLYRPAADEIGAATGGVKALGINVNQNVDIPNGSLNLSGELLGTVGDVKFGSGYFDLEYDDHLTIRDATNNISTVVAYPGGNVEIPNGHLQLSGISGKQAFTITNPGSSTSFHLGKPATGYGAITGDGGAELFKFFDGGNIEIPNGNLSVQSGNITTQDILANKTTDGDTASLITSGTGNGYWRVRDSANAQDITVFHEGGNVDIPNGNLNVGGGGITVTGDVKVGGGRYLRWPDRDADGSVWRFAPFPDETFEAQYGNSTDGYTKALTITKGGNVDIPNGDLTLGGDLYIGNNNIEFGSGRIDFKASTGIPSLNTEGADGTGGWNIYDSYNGSTIFEANEGGEISIPSGGLTVSGYSRFDGDHFQKSVDGSGFHLWKPSTAGGRDALMIWDDEPNTTGGAKKWTMRFKSDDNLVVKDWGYNDVLLLDQSQNATLPNGHLNTAGGVENQQRGAPTTSELASGNSMVYTSDGTDAGVAGDLMYAVNDAGTIKTSIIAAKANAT